jgi:hypothetical protein
MTVIITFGFLFWLHVAASLCIGLDAHRRGRSFIGWTLATFFTSILITWPLLLVLPRRTKSTEVVV